MKSIFCFLFMSSSQPRDYTW